MSLCYNLQWLLFSNNIPWNVATCQSESSRSESESESFEGPNVPEQHSAVSWKWIFVFMFCLHSVMTERQKSESEVNLYPHYAASVRVPVYARWQIVTGQCIFFLQAAPAHMQRSGLYLCRTAQVLCIWACSFITNAGPWRFLDGRSILNPSLQAFINPGTIWHRDVHMMEGGG